MEYKELPPRRRDVRHAQRKNMENPTTKWSICDEDFLFWTESMEPAQRKCVETLFFCVRCMEFCVDFLFFQLLPPPRQILAISTETWIRKSSFRSWLVGHFFFFAFGLYASRFFSLGFFLIVFWASKKMATLRSCPKVKAMEEEEEMEVVLSDWAMDSWKDHQKNTLASRLSMMTTNLIPSKNGGLYRRPW